MLVVTPPTVDDLRDLVQLARGMTDGDALSRAVMTDACLVARDQYTDAVLGFVVARREEPCQAHLLAIVVDKDFRGLGVGSALMRAVQDVMVRTGARAMHLEVDARNTRAQAFYARHGFAPEGLQTHAYPDGADAVVLARPL